MKMPWVANSVFGAVETRPSAPPSFTRTRPSCQIARLPSGAEPGMIASKVVVIEQVEPMVVLPVARTRNGHRQVDVADGAPASAWDGPFSLSVIRTVVVA